MTDRCDWREQVLEDYVSIDYGECFAFGVEQILQSAPTTRPRPGSGS